MDDNKLKSDVAKREEAILAFWRENNIFDKSLSQPAGKEPVGNFVFYDGPPFATGRPHFGHLLPTALKDVVPRYQTMRGKRVERRFGWDCHGLPVENIIEKELDLKNKKDIEKYGIAKFNQSAREAVLRYVSDWKKIIPRLGRWVDMENSYRTMDASYTESIWWVFKTLYDKKLIFEGYKSMHICPRCETTLANFEVNQGYKDITDLSVIVKFELVDEPGTYLLAWTTTPWTLPGNVALAVGQDIDYVQNEDNLIFAKDLLEKIPDISPNLVREFKGQELIGKKYQPIFDYYSTEADLENKENGWQVYGADFVTTEEGTGVVHIAPAFGEDDMNLSQTNKLPFIQHVEMNGRFKSEVTDFVGHLVKPKDNHQEADIEIIKYLAHQGHLFAKQKIVHSYPHCWRCETPLLNYATSSWFVKVTDFKDKLVANNNDVNWIPAHIKEGRFGKWLAGARDWAISRSRFWGAPIPVWRCEDCGQEKVIGSISDLVENSPSANNNYLVLRHGQAEHNQLNIISNNKDNPHHLTSEGKEEIKEVVKKLKDKKIDLIISSPYIRTKETAEIVAEGIGVSVKDIIYQDGLREVETGLDGRPVADYHALFKNTLDKFTQIPKGGENLNQLKERVTKVIYDLENKYKGKNILIISHEYPLWMLEAGIKGLSNQESAELKDSNHEYPKTGEVKTITLVQIPKNSQGELDLHRPYIDQIVLKCSCGQKLKRVTDVFDCWFESGAMPYAQAHYPFDKTDFNPDRNIGFPADFIAEGIDQTRGWFYSLLVLATALFDNTAYKNVVVNGLVLAEDGKKMSKRLNNYPDINLTIDQYGADALRLYLLSTPAVHADDFSFSETGLREFYRKIILRLENVLAFYNLYVDGSKINLENFAPKHILDRWIVARLAEINVNVTTSLDNYEVDRAVWYVESFIDDLSTWYIRRSRDRFKSDQLVEQNEVLNSTGYILIQLVKILAPLAPFIAEHIYQSLDFPLKQESVHLESWPKIDQVDKILIVKMSLIRNIVEEALALRAKEGVKVRQPLLCLKIKNQELAGEIELLNLVQEELNVKSIEIDSTITENVWLDFNIPTELKREGQGRELIRQVQDLRKEHKLKPDDLIVLYLISNDIGQEIVDVTKEVLKKVAGVKEIKYEKIDNLKLVTVDDASFQLAILKI